MKLGNKIKKNNPHWSFAGNVPDNFVDHITQSVPFYLEGHNLVCNISDFFCFENTTSYELGTSTGELLVKLSNHNKNKKNVKWIGIDNEIKMVNKAKKFCKKNKNISILHKDLIDYKFKNTNFIVSYYTMQFIQESVRQNIINKIYNSLNWGGAFVLFEKVRSPDARFQDISTLMYNDFKEKNGFKPDEILNKSKSLKGVLRPFSTKGNLEMLERAGFKDIQTVMKYICFEGFLCIK